MVDQVVRHAESLLFGSLGRPDIEVTVHLNRIEVDDFPAEVLSDAQGQIALA